MRASIANQAARSTSAVADRSSTIPVLRRLARQVEKLAWIQHCPEYRVRDALSLFRYCGRWRRCSRWGPSGRAFQLFDRARPRGLQALPVWWRRRHLRTRSLGCYRAAHSVRSRLFEHMLREATGCAAFSTSRVMAMVAGRSRSTACGVRKDGEVVMIGSMR